ncbi:MAG: T9SS type A sorting domain-containing protein [Bacteroidetes bacterium]|nr:T9SS type A sorting domain-containing protein [Bacteroidota bacterium]
MIKLNLRFLSKAVFLMALLLISFNSFTNQGGPGGGNTSAPGETPCGGCHGGATTSGGAWDNISLSGVPGNNYAAGQTYTITISGGSAATAKNGFQVTALNSGNAMAGSFVAGTGNAVSSAGARSYVTHTVAGVSSSSWSFQWTAPNPAVGTVTFYLALNATNSNNGTSGDIVYGKSFALSSGNPPVATITSPANGATFCVGDSVQFTGTATNSPTSYAWDFLANSPSSSTLQNPKIRVGPTAGSRTIRFRATNASGTSTNAQITINVIAKPAATITASSNIVCGNDSVTLTANSGTNFTYLWSPGNQTTQSIKTVTAGSYTVTVNAGGSCATTSAATVITTAPKPTVVLSLSKDTLCQGDSVQLTASSGMQFYEFFANGSRIDSTAANSIWFKPQGITQLNVKATAGPCNATSTTKVIFVATKAAAPVIACGPATPNSITYTIPGANPQISLDSGKTWASPNQGSNHFLSGLNPNQQVTVWGRNLTNAPCLVSQVSNKTCIAANCSPIAFKLLAPKLICLPTAQGNFGVSFTAQITNVSGAVNPYYKFVGFSIPLIGLFSKDTSGTYSTTISNQTTLGPFSISIIDSANSNCPTKDTTFMVSLIKPMNPTPILSLGKQLFCKTDSITLTPLLLAPSVLVVQYLRNDQLVATRTKSQGFAFGPVPVNPQFPDGSSLSLLAIDSISGCVTPSSPVITTVKELPVVDFTISKTNLEVVLNDTSSETTRRVWFLEGDSFPTTNRVFPYTFKNDGATQIVMKGYSQFECMNTASRAVTIMASGLSELPNAFGLSIYPNPATSNVTVNWQANQGVLNLTLADQLGRQVLLQSIQKGEGIYLNNLASGIYLLQLSDGTNLSQQKLVIE